jgi:hypothetical protein
MCHHCVATLDRDLRDVPQLVHELQTTLARQGRTSPVHHGGLAHERTGYHAGASDALAALERTLTAWVEALDYNIRAWYSTTAAAALLTHLEDLRTHPDADKAHTEITSAIAEARRTIDTAANRTIIEVGPCPEEGCTSMVYAYIPTEDSRPARMECRTNPTHRWEPMQWLRAGRRILDRMHALKASRA